MTGNRSLAWSLPIGIKYPFLPLLPIDGLLAKVLFYITICDQDASPELNGNEMGKLCLELYL